MKATALQTVLHSIYPPRCISCKTRVDGDFGLCGPCWRETPFLPAACCNHCGIGLPGLQDSEMDALCDECLTHARPWARGRAALAYRDNGRKLVLALKHGDRHDIIRPAGIWMARAAEPLLRPGMLVLPVPLHWLRMLKRRFNQSALLARAVARETGLAYAPDVLVRPRATQTLGGLGYEMRYRTMQGAIVVQERRRYRLAGRPVLLVDDVMTSGATLAAAAQACLEAGARDVNILVLARAGRDA